MAEYRSDTPYTKLSKNVSKGRGLESRTHSNLADTALAVV